MLYWFKKKSFLDSYKSNLYILNFGDSYLFVKGFILVFF